MVSLAGHVHGAHSAAVIAAALLLTSCGRSDSAAERPAAISGAPTTPAAPSSSSFADDMLTLDTHVDIPFDFVTAAVDPLDADLQVNLEKMRQGGLDAAFFVVYVGQTKRTAENYVAAQQAAMTKFDAIHRMTDQLYPNLIELAYTPNDLERIVAQGKLAAAIGIENGYVIGSDLDLLDRYYALGARYMTLVHNGNNDIADSAQPRPGLGDHGPEHDGVSAFGARVIERMNDLGIMVDVSHASKATALDAMRLSRAPVIASHSSVRALADHARNMNDETLLALKQNGGVIQIVAFDSYLTAQPKEEVEALAALRTQVGLSGRTGMEALSDEQRSAWQQGLDSIHERWPRSDVEDLVDHIDYAVDLIGIDHVGISSDFGGGGGIVGWDSAAETGNVTQEFLSRGYSEEDIAKIWGGNLLRVWHEVEDAAAER